MLDLLTDDPYFGFGLLSAKDLVIRAKTWVPVPVQQSVVVDKYESQSR